MVALLHYYAGCWELIQMQLRRDGASQRTASKVLLVVFSNSPKWHPAGLSIFLSSVSLPSVQSPTSMIVTGGVWTSSCPWWWSWWESILFQVYTRYGKCYTFNGNKTTSRKSKQGGMGNGLEIMLDIQQDEYLPIWRETSKPQKLFVQCNPIICYSTR